MIKCSDREQKVFIPWYWVECEDLKGQNPFFSIWKMEDRKHINNLRSRYVEGLRKLGISVVDKEQIDESTIYFVPDVYHFGKDTSDGRKKLNAMIKNSAKGKINFPKTLTVDEYFCDSKNPPFYPVCFKNELADKGVDKFLIETREQVLKLLNYCHDNIVGPESDKYIKLFGNCVFQKYLATPTEYETFFRVLVGASGSQIEANLVYFSKSGDNNELVGDIEKDILDTKSKYYVGCRQLKKYSELGRINLPIDYKPSDRTKSILKAHGIDSSTGEIPSEVLDALRLIMKDCNPVLGIMCGFDLILDNKGDWYVIESNMYPEVYGVVKKRCISDYDRNIIIKNRIDLELRHEELMRFLGLDYTFAEVIGENSSLQIKTSGVSNGKFGGTKPHSKKNKKGKK